MIHRIISSLFFIFYITNQAAWAQDDTLLNSRKVQLSLSKDKREKLRILNSICEQTFNDTVEFMHYSSMAKEAAKELNDAAGIANVQAIKGSYYLSFNRYELANEQFLLSLKGYLDNNDQFRVAILNTAIGRLYNLWGKKDSALIFYDQAAAIFKKLSAKKELAALYSDYGVSLADLGKRKTALKYYLEGLKIAENIGDSVIIATVCSSLGKFMLEEKKCKEAKEWLSRCILITAVINENTTRGEALLNLGKVYASELNYTEGVNYLKMANAVFEKISSKRGMLDVDNDLWGIFLSQEKYAEAIYYLKKALDLVEALNLFSGLAHIQERIGFAYTKLKLFPEAKGWLEKAEQSAIKYNDRYSLGKIYSHRAGYDSAAGDFEQAFEHQSKFLVISDRLLNEKLGTQISELKSKYEAQKKEHTIREQQFQITRQNYLIGGIFCLLVFGGMLGISYQKRSKLKQEKRLQLEIMKQQDLATKAIIEAEEKERKRIAFDLHDGVGQMMSAVKMNLSSFESRLKFSDEAEMNSFYKIISLVDESCKEVRNVSHNMMPNALLKSGLSYAVKDFIDKIDSSILKVTLHAEGLNERFDGNAETVLYRVIQECVNNVIKHAGANKLDVSLIKDNDGIAATIEDNGKGFDSSLKEKFEGIGLKNIIARIKYLKGTIDFDTSPGRGTLVAMHIPLS